MVCVRLVYPKRFSIFSMISALCTLCMLCTLIYRLINNNIIYRILHGGLVGIYMLL